MSKGIVNQRPFSRKKRKKSFKKMMNRSGISVPEVNISQKLKHILSRGICFTLLIIIGILILIKSLFFKPEQTILNVKFSEDTIATYQDIELFNMISNEVKGKNYYILSSKKDTLLGKIQKQFPFVGEIELQLEKQSSETNTEPQMITIGIELPKHLPLTGSFQITTGTYQTIQTVSPLRTGVINDKGGGTLGIQIMYYDPKILIKLNDKIFAVRNENTYVELKEGMLLGIREPDEEPLFTIETPQYLNGINNLDGFFFEISLEKIMHIVSLAKKEFGYNMTRFVYLAGSSRFAIFTNDQKTLYFNFPEGGDIDQQRDTQIFKYNTIKDKYTNFEKIENIDLGALEENKTIIKNY